MKKKSLAAVRSLFEQNLSLVGNSQLLKTASSTFTCSIHNCQASNILIKISSKRMKLLLTVFFSDVQGNIFHLSSSNSLLFQSIIFPVSYWHILFQITYFSCLSNLNRNGIFLLAAIQLSPDALHTQKSLYANQYEYWLSSLLIADNHHF